MLCPEVWNFSPPACSFKFKRGNLSELKTHSEHIVNSHHFNHLVSVVLPDAINVPEVIKVSLNEDSDYYVIKDLLVSEIVNKEFIEAFVKKGHLTILSNGTNIDTDNCVAVTPSGHLILSLLKQTYQELGLEGKPSFFSQKKPNRYVVQLDLKEEHLQPGKKFYKRVQQCLEENVQLKMDFLVTWNPPEENICPSSVAAYFSSRGYKVLLCQPKSISKISYNVKVPETVPNDNSDAMELIEWLGAFSIGADLEPGETDNYLSTYQSHLQTQEIGAVVHLQWRGFFCCKQISRLLDELRKYISQRNSIPWVSMYVQGFSDSPVSWNLKEHQFFTNGDNNYVILLQPNNSFMTCSYISSNKRPKEKTK